MKILHFSPQTPSYYSGGEIAVHQSQRMLDPENNIVDYIGPKIEVESIRNKYHTAYELEPADSVKDYLHMLIHLQRNKRFPAWNRIIRKNNDVTWIIFIYGYYLPVCSRNYTNSPIVCICFCKPFIFMLF